VASYGVELVAGGKGGTGYDPELAILVVPLTIKSYNNNNYGDNMHVE